MWKNVVEPERPQITIWRMRILFWIHKATNTQSEYVILVAFPLQRWSHERASMLRYAYRQSCSELLKFLSSPHSFKSAKFYFRILSFTETSVSAGWFCCLIFVGYCVQISNRKSTILAEIKYVSPPVSLFLFSFNNRPNIQLDIAWALDSTIE
jgi:hypothetical protein